MTDSSGQETFGFLSYTHTDNEADKGRLTEFRLRLEAEIKVQTTRVIRIFQDRQGLGWGEDWQKKITDSIDQAAFLVPILTPSYFKSEPCRLEFERFMSRERTLGRSDLIFPVYYVKCPEMESSPKTDSIAIEAGRHHWTDWRELRFESIDSPTVGKHIAELAEQLVVALDRTHPHDPPASVAESSPDTGSEFSFAQQFLDGGAVDATFSSERVAEFRKGMRDDVVASMPPQLTHIEFLQRAGLLKNGSLSYTGLLLFGENPSLTLPSAMVQCVQFFGQSRSDNPKTIHIPDSVPQMIVRAWDFVAGLSSLGEKVKPGSPYAETDYKYPMVAIRELIANAVVHRDYEAQNSCVEVGVFSDRIEIISPGIWGGHGQLDSPARKALGDLAQDSYRRNFRLAHILTWSKLVEGVGAGIPQANRGLQCRGCS